MYGVPDSSQIWTKYLKGKIVLSSFHMHKVYISLSPKSELFTKQQQNYASPSESEKVLFDLFMQSLYIIKIHF